MRLNILYPSPITAVESDSAVNRIKMPYDVLVEIAKGYKAKVELGATEFHIPKKAATIKVEPNKIVLYSGTKKLATTNYPSDGMLQHGFDLEIKAIHDLIKSKVDELADVKPQPTPRPTPTPAAAPTTRPAPTPRPVGNKVPDVPVSNEKGGKPLNVAGHEALCMKLGQALSQGGDKAAVNKELNAYLNGNNLTTAWATKIVERVRYVASHFGWKKEKPVHQVDVSEPAAVTTPPKVNAAPADGVVVNTDKGMVKFTGQEPNKVSKATVDAAVTSAKYGAQASIIKKLKSRVMGFGIPIGNKQAGTTEVQLFPFAYTSANKKFKTPMGEITKNQIFSIMAGITADAPRGGKKQATDDNVCRVCGQELGTNNMVGTTITYPELAAAHYRKHGLSMSWIKKNVQDKTTGKIFSVTYLGKNDEIPNVVK